MDTQTPPNDPNQSPNTATPTTDLASTSSAPAYGGLPMPQPDVQLQPVKPVRSRRSRKWLLLVGLPILLLGGGSVAAYYGYYQPRQTNKKVLNAIYNLANENEYSSVKVAAEITPAESTSPAFSIDMTTGSDGSGNMRADMDITYSALRLSGSAIVRNEDKTAYLKINELPALLSLAEGYLGSDITALGDKVGDKWLKFDTSTLDNSGLVSESQTDEATACVTAVQDLFGKDRQAFLDQIAKIYESHSFLTAKKAGSETIDGQETTKYRLTIDKTKLAEFVLSDQLTLGTVEQACNMSNASATDQDRQKLVDDLNKLTITNTELWLNQAGKVVKMATNLAAEGTGMVMSMTFGNTPLDASAPTSVISTDELLQEYQTLMLNSLLQSNETSLPLDSFEGLESL